MPRLFPGEVAVGYARVAVERSVDHYPEGLTYAIPAELKSLLPGERVIVPLGRGDTATSGIVIDISDSIDIDPELVKPISKRDESAARLPQQLLELARWISSYYCSPIGMTLASMLPAAVKKNIGSVRKTFIDLGDPIPLEEKIPSKQKHVLEVLANLPANQRPIEMHELMEKAQLQSTASIKSLLERGLLESTHRSVIEAAWSEHAVDERVPDRLSEEQTRVVNAIGATIGLGFCTHLLYGVTGSGKTEVYIRLIQRVIDAGQSAILLVPEISLTPQTGGRLIGRFPDHRVAVLHSGLTAAQRHQQWALAASGLAHIVLGARSAVFAPVPDDKLGLIVIDEEHDSSYKQDQVPRYHGRDVAIRRAQIARCPIVLGSATPSLESWWNANAVGAVELPSRDREGAISPNTDTSHNRSLMVAAQNLPRSRFALHKLTKRAPGLHLPKVQVVDFRQQMRDQAREHHDRHVHLLGPILESAVAHTLQSGGQLLILLNRRGYANYIACPSSRCGWIMTCDHCDVTVVYHLNQKLPSKENGYVRCHHCLTERKLPAACPQCGSKISTFGLGTQRVEEELSRKFPELIEGQTMLRMDSDSMTSAREYHRALERFGTGEIKLLVGTQMIAKGLDFPGVRLVGVINADTSINLPDFRASERTFQLVNQVAGRCGRSADPGLTIVQTFNPSSPAIRLAAEHDYETFASQELAERARVGLPPTTRMARIVVRDEDHIRCIEAARGLARSLQEIVAAETRSAIKLRGPAPCPIARIADKHRQQIEIFAPNAASLQNVLVKARNAGLLKADTDMAIDVDPIALL